MNADNEHMVIAVKANPELYDLIAKEADERQVAMGELLVEFATKHFKRPDLNFVPRKPLGRPRKDRATAEAS